MAATPLWMFWWMHVTHLRILSPQSIWGSLFVASVGVLPAGAASAGVGEGGGTPTPASTTGVDAGELTRLA